MTAALIIAAGQGRDRRQIEPDREVGALSAVKRCVLTFQAAGVARVVVVCGDREDGRTEKLVAHMNVTFLFSSDAGEMLDSVKQGLAFLQGKCDDVLIAHTDVPLFQVETVRALLEAGGGLCVPVCGGRGGHPIRLGAGYIPEILAYGGSGGLAGALRAAGLARTEVPVEDPGILTHIQDRDGCEALLSVQREPRLRPAFRFQLMRDQPFYGPGHTNCCSSPRRPARCWTPAVTWASPTARGGRSSPIWSGRWAARCWSAPGAARTAAHPR